MGIVGGDLVRSPVVFITVALTGVQVGQSMLRSTASTGDKLAVTGYVGGSGGGLKLLPDVAAGQILKDSGVVTAMDISVGLADDLSKLCLSSGVSARIFSDQIPVHPLLKKTFPKQYLDLALNGGEDYKLLFAAPQAVMELVMPQLTEGASVIGDIIGGEPGRVVIVDSSGTETVATRHGWDYFS